MFTVPYQGADGVISVENDKSGGIFTVRLYEKHVGNRNDGHGTIRITTVK